MPTLLLVGAFGPKLGALFGIDNSSFMVWILAIFCFLNLLLAIYLHCVVEVKRKSKKISERECEERSTYISECLTDTNASLARLAE